MFPLIRRLSHIEPKAVRLIIGQTVSTVVLFAGIRLLLEFAPPALFGEYALWIGAVTLAKNAISRPIGQAVVKFDAELDESVKSAFRRALVLWWFPRTLAVAAAAALAARTVVPDSPTAASIAAVAMLAAWCLRDVEAAALNAGQQHDLFTLNDCVDVICRQGGPVLAAWWFGASLATLLSGAAMGQVASMAFMWMTVGRCWRESGIRLTPTAAQTVAAAKQFMIPVLPTSLLGWINGMSDRYIIAAILGVPSAGLWSAAYPLASRPYLMVSTMTNLLFRPPFMRASALGTPDDISAVLRRWTATVVAVSVAGVIAYLLLSDLVVAIVLAPEYREVSQLLPWIAAGNALIILDRIAEARLHAQNRTKAALLADCAGAATSIFVVALFAARYGLYGACVACPIYGGVKAWLMWRLAASQNADPDAAATPTRYIGRTAESADA